MKNINDYINEQYDDLKTSKEMKPEYKETVEKVRKILKDFKTEESKIYLFDNFVDKYGTVTCVFSGGLNGPGKWEDYLQDLSKLVKAIKDAGIHIWLISEETDCPDDVFTANFGIAIKNN